MTSHLASESARSRRPPSRRSRVVLLGGLLLLLTSLLLCVPVAGIGLWRLLDSVPFLGVPVDAFGNPLPIQGIPELACGVTGIVTFGALALACGLRLRACVRDGA